MKALKSLLGLFIPVKKNPVEIRVRVDREYEPTIAVEDIPLGLIMIVIAIITNLIMK